MIFQKHTDDQQWPAVFFYKVINMYSFVLLHK